jgi:hypothetical protein
MTWPSVETKVKASGVDIVDSHFDTTTKDRYDFK